MVFQVYQQLGLPGRSGTPTTEASIIILDLSVVSANTHSMVPAVTIITLHL